MSEYRQTLSEAVFRFPLKAAFALLPARAERLGHASTGPGYADRASLSKRAEVMTWLKENFKIIPTPTRKSR